MMIHLEYPASDRRRRLVALLAHCLHLLPPLDYLLLPILNEPRALITVLLYSLVLHGVMVAAHDFPEVRHIVGFAHGVGFAFKTSVGHGEVAFEGGTVRLLFPHDFPFVEGTMPR
jgi:hypothetical protein